MNALEVLLVVSCDVFFVPVILFLCRKMLAKLSRSFTSKTFLLVNERETVRRQRL